MQWLRELIDENTPKTNPRICEGYAYHEMKNPEVYINNVFEYIARDIPGLVYKGYKICTPIEEFAEKTKKRNNRRCCDIGNNSVFLVKYYFSYEGEDLPEVPLYLPIISQGSVVNIGDSSFVISPVLSDRVISIGDNNVFVKLLRSKMKFFRQTHNVMINGVSESIQMIHGQFMNKSDKAKTIKRSNTAISTLPHYLFCKMGVKEAFRKYCGIDLVIGTSEITPTNYPISEWTICSSRQMSKPKAVKKEYYVPTIIKVAIRNSQFTPLAKSFVGSMFYAIDLFPEKLTIEYIDSITFWRIVLGFILISEDYSGGVLQLEMDNHIHSLSTYLDPPIIKTLNEDGFKIEDIFDLFVRIIENYSKWILENSNKLNSIYDKQLTVMSDVMVNIVHPIYKLYYKIRGATNVPGKVLQYNELKYIFAQHLKAGLIFGIRKKHPEINSLSYSGDNMFLKFTQNVLLQSDLTNSSSGGISADDPTRQLHISVIEVGSYVNTPKDHPDGRNRINPFLHLDPNGVVMRNPNLVELLDDVQNKIQR